MKLKTLLEPRNPLHNLTLAQVGWFYEPISETNNWYSN